MGKTNINVCQPTNINKWLFICKNENQMNHLPYVTRRIDCLCEKGCQHQVISVTTDYLIPKDEVASFLEDVKHGLL